MTFVSPDIVDTVYTRPPRKPFEAMPVGGGDLTAMVRVADTIELHLGKCDSWGFRDWHNRIHNCELLSPGHVTIHLSPDPVEPGQLLGFEQRLSPLRGMVETTIRTRSGDLTIQVWGDVQSNVLVVDIDDRRSDRAGAEVELWHWRNEPGCNVLGNAILSEEIQAEAVLSEREPGQVDPYQGRGIGIALGADVAAETKWWGQEMLLQSYPLRSPDGAAASASSVSYGEMLGGTIRVCPAVPAAWSGSFRLHAMGGFVVACDVAAGVPTRVEITSERGAPCAIANPWPGDALLQSGAKSARLGAGPLLQFATVAGETYVLLPGNS